MRPATDKQGARWQYGRRLALARELKMDPSQLSRFLNLVNLAPKIQAYIRGLPPTTHRSIITDRDWHRLARTHDRESQLREFDVLLDTAEGHFTSSANIEPRKEAAPTFA